MICAMNEAFNGVSCVKIATVEEGEIVVEKQSFIICWNSNRYQIL